MAQFEITDIHTAAEAANKLAAHDDLLKQIEDIRNRLTSLKSSALLHANNHLFDSFGAVHLAAGEADNVLEDLASDIRPAREEIDGARKLWESVEAYNEPGRASMGGAA